MYARKWIWHNETGSERYAGYLNFSGDVPAKLFSCCSFVSSAKTFYTIKFRYSLLGIGLMGARKM
jgi:hypothetical protein